MMATSRCTARNRSEEHLRDSLRGAPVAVEDRSFRRHPGGGDERGEGRSGGRPGQLDVAAEPDPLALERRSSAGVCREHDGLLEAVEAFGYPGEPRVQGGRLAVEGGGD